VPFTSAKPLIDLPISAVLVGTVLGAWIGWHALISSASNTNRVNVQGKRFMINSPFVLHWPGKITASSTHCVS
jgi:hypothetical protein